MNFNDGCELPVADLLRIGHASLVGQVAPWLVHQAVNPLNAGQGLTTQLIEEYSQESALDVVQVCEDLRLIEAQGLRLFDVFCQMRDFSTTLVINPQPAPLDVIDVVRQAASFLQPLAERRQAPILVDAPVGEERIQLEGARLHLLALFLRLFHNALVRTSAGEVRVSIEDAADEICVQVRDSGPGPGADNIERMHATLHSANEQVAALGVHMARAIAESHGGAMIVEPHAKGGETVTVTLSRVRSRS